MRETPWDCSWSFCWFQRAFSLFCTCLWRVADGTELSCLRTMWSSHKLHSSLFSTIHGLSIIYEGFTIAHLPFWLIVFGWRRSKGLFRLFLSFSTTGRFTATIFGGLRPLLKTKIGNFYIFGVFLWTSLCSTPESIISEQNPPQDFGNIPLARSILLWKST